MTNLELTLNSLAEATATEISKTKNPKTMSAHTSVAKQGATIAKEAKEKIEKKIGHSIVSPLNAKSLHQIESVTPRPATLPKRSQRK